MERLFSFKVAKMTCLEIQKELEFEYNRMLNKLGKPVDRTGGNDTSNGKRPITILP
jgi:hypothetical protein